MLSSEWYGGADLPSRSRCRIRVAHSDWPRSRVPSVARTHTVTCRAKASTQAAKACGTRHSRIWQGGCAGVARPGTAVGRMRACTHATRQAASRCIAHRSVLAGEHGHDVGVLVETNLKSTGAAHKHMSVNRLRLRARRLRYGRAWSAEAAWRQERAAYARGGRHAACGSQAAHRLDRKKVSSRGGCDGRYEKKYEGAPESTAGFCCCLLPKHASQAYCLMLMNVVVATAQLLTTAQAMLKMKSACFEKASQEIGVPRGKKSERYRSTPRYRSSDRSK